ncbi:MAG: electron transfer flavoprotein subunit beta [Ignavibacteria bacterium GWB2_36_8]|nr:MAG: electron transfer flavoprotein subunit beta [Ignavibacteria bacterium GWB2_36_8]OGU48951.1 MAG: electron transfer flavoprotein subunit beta [Ignavibacteria bacterium GWC2_36_12]
MNIAVCVSHVPDTATKIKIGDDNKTINKAGVTYIINPYDEFAVEEALTWKEKAGGDSKITILSVGGDSNKETIRKALAMGADDGILLKDDNPRDSMGIAKALSKEIKSHKFDVVFCGKQSVDYDAGAVPQMLAEFLDYSCATVVVALKMDGNKIIAEREVEGGREVVELELPAVIGAQKGLNEPRYASLKGIMSAKKKTIEEKPAAQAENLSEIIKMYSPPAKQSGRILGTDASAVPELVRLLREEAKVI